MPTAEPAAGAVLRLLPPTPGALVAGGPPVGFTAQLANRGTAAFTGVVPLASLRGDENDASHRALRAGEVLFQVRTPTGWEQVPLATDCDGALRGGPAALATDLAPGGTAQYDFRLSVSDRTPEARQLDVRLGVRSAAGDSFRDAPRLTLPIAPTADPAGTPSAAPPGAGDAAPGPTASGSAPVPRTEALGVRPSAAPSDSPVPTVVPTVTVSLTGASAQLPLAAGADRPPLSLLISGVALITLGAVGLTLVLTHRR
ncbi:hypothetical protein [Kitasatospora sp. NPDC088134]|uniref:hypothetical protein n=1 Tax=Kitasatospora sp. NPDC088134 TaxID=3364071 RepID=UPI0037FD1D31